MVIFYRMIIICSFIFFGSCISNTGNKTDCKKFILGKWAGELMNTEMTLIFNDDGTAIFDYIAFGGKKSEEVYSLDECKLLVSKYPDGLIINIISSDEVSFSPINSGLKKDIDIIYSINFKRK